MSDYALSVVIPVYNGARTIGRVVEALASLPIANQMEVVLTYDGSPDDSLAVCLALAEEGKLPITVVEHARNYGEHNAVMSGLRHARGAYIVTMDDDLQNPPEEVQRLFEHARDGGYDVVYSYYETKEHESWRNLGSRLTNWVAGVLMDKPKGLYLSSFRCMSAFVAREITRNTGPFPYVDGLILQVTQRIGTLKVRHLPRAEGQSNYTLARLFRLFMSMALNFSAIPLRAATLLGLAMGAVGFLALIIVLIEVLFGTPPTGWASTIAILLVVAGVQLLMLGVIGEYLGRLFLTINQRPQSTVRHVVRGRLARDDRTLRETDAV
ncbi:MAG: glycosyltransferase [Alphaproteobacteria bacterium]|nr:MAG: glycosyltransferase [Alphaproteobacteria bacterium]